METNEPKRNPALAAAQRLTFHDVQDLEQKIGPSSRSTAAQVRDRLTTLRTHLVAQFHHEEQDGYGQAVLAEAPQFERTVRTLLGEHAHLLSALDELLQQARTAESRDPALFEKAEAWIGRFREHESQENTLLEDAFNVVCPAED
jgi:hypothetical protein